MAGDSGDGHPYSATVGAMYIFNLIVGAGALALPYAFAHAGVIAGSVLLVVLAFFSFVAVTFTVEAMAVANALLRRFPSGRDQPLASDLTVNFASGSTDTEATALLSSDDKDPFEISTRVEMGRMAEMFLPSLGSKLFYACMIIYLYGDLCIYAVAIPKSLQSVTCDYGGNHTDTGGCPSSLGYHGTYYVYLTMVTVLLGPLCFFNVQKTKWLQIGTSVLRWTTFLIMISLATIGIARNKGFSDTDPIPPAADSVPTVRISGMPQLFGTSIYAFMCHHSLPSLVVPIQSKRRLNGMFVVDFVMVLAFYMLLSLTAVFRFPTGDLKDLYTLNFQHFHVKFISYFLALFPVFTLSANFPIIAITLRNNLRTLVQQRNIDIPPLLDKYGFPLLAIVPPIIVAFFTEDVGFLVGFTGSYAGVGIQYITPAMLCLYARRTSIMQRLDAAKNKHASVFRHPLWIYFVCLWAAACVALVTVNHILTGK